ncbi:MAG: hypothetical protein M3N24_06250 [Actinomycetota bacterium]|nr:hypothetical protein [Actinomycetota bacterium]
MDIASTLINVFVVVALGTFLTYMTRERHRELKEHIARLEARMDAGFNAVRSDLTAVALAVGAEAPRPSQHSGNG